LLIFSSIFYAKTFKNSQRRSKVSPHRLVESGRIKPKDVFIVTNVDNRHHINIVMDFGKYLKVMMPEPGRHVGTNRDKTFNYVQPYIYLAAYNS
jgi:hypothetical protein